MDQWQEETLFCLQWKCTLVVKKCAQHCVTDLEDYKKSFPYDKIVENIDRHLNCIRPLRFATPIPLLLDTVFSLLYTNILSGISNPCFLKPCLTFIQNWEEIKIEEETEEGNKVESIIRVPAQVNWARDCVKAIDRVWRLPFTEFQIY